ncbi:hypothetical protein Tco_1165247 [Tanacetum coccineum]
MGDENPIRTLGDYSRPSYEGYRNTIELPKENNMCQIDRAASGKLRNKNADESWEIIKNLALYDHEGWYETKEFVKLLKAISTPQDVLKTPNRRLLELEDRINFLLKGPRPTPVPSSAYTPMRPSPQPQALNTTFKARVQDYMAAQTERIGRFENGILKQQEEINANKGDEKSNERMETPKNTEKSTETGTETPLTGVKTKDEAENRPETKSIKTHNNNEVEDSPGS